MIDSKSSASVSTSLGWMLSVTVVLALEDRGIGEELGAGETNRKLSLLTFFLYLCIAEWNSY